MGSFQAASATRKYTQRYTQSLYIRRACIYDGPVYCFVKCLLACREGNVLTAPLVIENAMNGSYDPKDWTREGLTRICGNNSMMIVPEQWCAQQGGKGCHMVREDLASLPGTSLADVHETNLTEAEITSFADFMRAQVWLD